MIKTTAAILTFSLFSLVSGNAFCQHELHLFYISGSVHDKNPSLRISDKQFEHFSKLRTELKDKPVLACFSKQDRPLITRSFRDEDISGFLAAIRDSASREQPDYLTENSEIRDPLYQQENSKNLDQLTFYFFMSPGALENASERPEAPLYSLPLEMLHVLGSLNAQARVVLYYDKSKLTVSEDEIYYKLSFYNPGEKLIFEFKPL